MSDGALHIRATAFRVGRAGAAPLDLAIPVETAIEIAVAGIPIAVMMATPADLEDFATGFCMTEGIVAGPGDLRAIRRSEGAEGIRLDLDLAPHSTSRHLARRRALSGRSGCGVCGIEDLKALSRPLAPVAGLRPVTLDAVERALAELERRQSLNAETHAVHAAAWATRDGAIAHLREDVGRHNALDKLIGAALRDGIDPTSGFLVITSRCSFEMVEKSAAFGAGLLVAISAPTSLALARAQALGMGLVAIARRDGVVEFAGSSILGPLEAVA